MWISPVFRSDVKTLTGEKTCQPLFGFFARNICHVVTGCSARVIGSPEPSKVAAAVVSIYPIKRLPVCSLFVKAPIHYQALPYNRLDTKHTVVTGAGRLLLPRRTVS